MSDPAVATGISDLVYESKPAPAEPDALDDDLVNAWAANLGDDDLLGNNAPAMNRVRIYFSVKFELGSLSHFRILFGLYRISCILPCT